MLLVFPCYIFSFGNKTILNDLFGIKVKVLRINYWLWLQSKERRVQASINSTIILFTQVWFSKLF